MKWTRWLLLFTAVFLCAAWLALYFDSVRHLLDAEHLITDLRQLAFEDTDFAIARAYSDHHDGTSLGNGSSDCTAASCDFFLHVTPAITSLRHTSNNEQPNMVPLLAVLGLRPWGVSATLSIRNNQLTHLRFTAAQARFKQPLEYVVDIAVDPTSPPSKDPEPTFTVVRPQISGPATEFVQVWAEPDEARTWRRALDLDVACFITLFHGCKMQQLAPTLSE